MNKVAIITFIAGLAGGQVISSILSKPESHETTGIAYRSDDNSLKKIEKENSQLKIQVKKLQQRIKIQASAAVRPPSTLANNNPTITKSTEKANIQLKTTTLSEEAIQNRIAEIKDDIQTHVDNSDGKALVNLVKELRTFGEAGFPHMARIASILDVDNWREGKFRGTYNKHDFDKLFSTEIYTWALSENNFNEVNASFRTRAYRALPYHDDVDNLDALLVSALGKEKSRWAKNTLNRTLRERPSEENAKAIIERLQTENDLSQDARQDLESVLYSMPGNDVDHYLDVLISSAQEESEIDRLTYSKLKRNPAETGYLIRSISDNTQAQKLGLKPGDTIVKYGNYELKKMSIYEAKQSMKGTQEIPITILRGDQEIVVNAQAGQIGIDGDRVRKK